MKKFRVVVGIAILAAPLCGSVFGQDDFQSIDINSILNQGGNNRGNNRGPSIPDSKLLFKDIQDILKKGKTPLEKAQEKPLQSLLDTEIVALTDKLQLMRNNNGYPNNNNNNNAATNTAATNTAANNKATAAKGATPNPPSEQAIKVDTITSLKNEDFLNTKLPLFLSPEQVALIQKAHAEDKNNSTCLGGLLDHYFNQMNNSNRGNNSNNNFNNNRGNYNNNSNNNNSNSKEALRPNGQKYCMTQEATPLDRLEPIRKVLAKGNLPLAPDKNTIAEVVMKAELQDLDAALRTGLTSNNNNSGNFNRGGNNNNNNRNNFQQVIQTTTDNLYKKVEAMLNPMQAATIQKWHYTEMLSRTPIDALIAVNAMQDTPLSEEQITKVTAAWPELRKEIEKKAKDAKLQITEKQRDSEAMRRILDMIEPEQVASYQLAKKYGPEAVAGK